MKTGTKGEDMEMKKKKEEKKTVNLCAPNIIDKYRVRETRASRRLLMEANRMKKKTVWKNERR